MHTPPVVDSDSAPKTQANRALQRLAGAVLIQAIQDASSGPFRIREEALRWIDGETDAGMTFNLCCSLLGRDPDDVRQRLRNRHYIPKLDPETEITAASGRYGTGDSLVNYLFAARAS